MRLRADASSPIAEAKERKLPQAKAADVSSQ
jgi:hypothetical protein